MFCQYFTTWENSTAEKKWVGSNVLSSVFFPIKCYSVPLTSFPSSIHFLTTFTRVSPGGFPQSSCVSELKEWDFTLTRHQLPKHPAEKTSMIHSCTSTLKRQTPQLSLYMGRWKLKLIQCLVGVFIMIFKNV